MERRSNYIAQSWPIAGGKIEVVLTTPDPASKAHFELMHDVCKAIEMWDAIHDRGEGRTSEG